MTVIISLRKTICYIFPLSMESNGSEKSTNNGVALKFSFDDLTVESDVVTQKVFWFFLRIFLTSDWIWLKNRTLWTLSAIAEELCLCSFCWFQDHLSWKRGGCSLLSISLLFCLYTVLRGMLLLHFYIQIIQEHWMKTWTWVLGTRVYLRLGREMLLPKKQSLRSSLFTTKWCQCIFTASVMAAIPFWCCPQEK